MPIDLSDPRLETSYSKNVSILHSLSTTEQVQLLRELARVSGHIVHVIKYVPDPVAVVERGFGLGILANLAAVIAGGKPSRFPDQEWSHFTTSTDIDTQILSQLHSGKKPTNFGPNWNVSSWTDEGKALEALYKRQAIVVEWILLAEFQTAWMLNLRDRILRGEEELSAGRVVSARLSQADFGIIDDFAAYVKSQAYVDLATKVSGYMAWSSGSEGWGSTAWKPVVDGLPIIRMPLNPLDLNSAQNIKYDSTRLRNTFTKGSGVTYNAKTRASTIQYLLGDVPGLKSKLTSLIAVVVEQGAQQVAAEQARAAGIVALPETPFYMKPAFTLAAAGVIFAVGYTVLKRK